MGLAVYHKSDHATPRPPVFDPNINVHLGRLMRPYHKITFQYKTTPRPLVFDPNMNVHLGRFMRPYHKITFQYKTAPRPLVFDKRPIAV